MNQPDTNRRWVTLHWAIILVAGACSYWGALHPFSGDTANSRMATVYALVHHGSWEIDPVEYPNPFSVGTVDKVRVEGRLYSSKPPVMPLFMAAQYWVLHHFLGYDLDREVDRNPVLGLLTATCISLPFFLSGIAFYLLQGLWQIKPWVKAITLLSLMWGSEYAGYAGTLNNHVPATACLMGALWGCWGVKDRPTARAGLCCAVLGVLLGLAVTIDLPSALFVVPLGIGFIVKFSKVNVAWGVAGASIPLLIHAVVMIALSGSPLPFQLNQAYYLYEESYWRSPVGIDALNHPWGLYLFNMTVGRVGHFILYPLLLVGGLGLLRESLLKTSPYRWWGLGGVGALCMLMFYYVSNTNNYGGISFGFRWLIIATPFLLMGLSLCLQRVHKKTAIALICVLLSIGIFSTHQCRKAPWSLHQEWPTKIYGPLY